MISRALAAIVALTPVGFVAQVYNDHANQAVLRAQVDDLRRDIAELRVGIETVTQMSRAIIDAHKLGEKKNGS